MIGINPMNEASTDVIGRVHKKHGRPHIVDPHGHQERLLRRADPASERSGESIMRFEPERPRPIRRECIAALADD